MKRFIFGSIAVAGLVVASTTQAITVFVSSTVAAWSGSGTITDPYGSIQEAYASLWGTSGDHSILLLPGTYTGDNIGKNTWGNGLIDFWDGGGESGGIITPFGAGRAANTFTLAGLGSVVLDRDTIAGQNALYTASNPRGIFSIGAANLDNMIVKDLEIRLTADGASLIGKGFGGSQEFLFENVRLFMGTGDGLSRTGIYVDDLPATGEVVFRNSNIYFDPDNYLDGDTRIFGRFFAPDVQPGVVQDAIVHGDNSSRIWTWNDTGSFFDPNQYSILADLTIIQAGARNALGTDWDFWNLNGSNAAGNNPNSVFYMNYFLTTLPVDDDDDDVVGGVPEPSTVVLLALGAGLVAARRRFTR